MASVRHIAKVVGVSASTVSRALNNHPRVAPEVRIKVLDAMNQSRYMPAVGRRNTSNIAFAYTGDITLHSPFDSALVQGVLEQIAPHDLDLIILNLSRAKLPHETYTQMFIRKGGARRSPALDIGHQGFVRAGRGRRISARGGGGAF
jgi:DNA-binding LacI/PurR family transcriptional regulator